MQYTQSSRITQQVKNLFPLQIIHRQSYFVIYDLIRGLLDAFRDHVIVVLPRLRSFPPPPWVTAQKWQHPNCVWGFCVGNGYIFQLSSFAKNNVLAPINGVLLKITNLAYLQPSLSQENVIRRVWETRLTLAQPDRNTHHENEKAGIFFFFSPNLFYFNSPMTDTPSKQKANPAWPLTDEITHSFSGQHSMARTHTCKTFSEENRLVGRTIDGRADYPQDSCKHWSQSRVLNSLSFGHIHILLFPSLTDAITHRLIDFHPFYIQKD